MPLPRIWGDFHYLAWEITYCRFRRLTRVSDRFPRESRNQKLVAGKRRIGQHRVSMQLLVSWYCTALWAVRSRLISRGRVPVLVEWGLTSGLKDSLQDKPSLMSKAKWWEQRADPPSSSKLMPGAGGMWTWSFLNYVLGGNKSHLTFYRFSGAPRNTRNLYPSFYLYLNNFTSIAEIGRKGGKRGLWEN